MTLFAQMMIWRKIDDGVAVRYVCLEDIRQKKFIVQSADFFRLPAAGNDFLAFERQFVELFLDVSTGRTDWSESIEDAIADHERMFP